MERYSAAASTIEQISIGDEEDELVVTVAVAVVVGHCDALETSSPLPTLSPAHSKAESPTDNNTQQNTIAITIIGTYMQTYISR